MLLHTTKKGPRGVDLRRSEVESGCFGLLNSLNAAAPGASRDPLRFRVSGLGFIGLIEIIGFIGLIGLIGFIGFRV